MRLKPDNNMELSGRTDCAFTTDKTDITRNSAYREPPTAKGPRTVGPSVPTSRLVFVATSASKSWGRLGD